MTLILEIKTIQTNAFKILIEALKEFLLDVNIEFTKMKTVNDEKQGGLSIIALNNSSSILVHLKLHAHNFDYYNCIREKINIGVNMTYLYKLIKTINNNDILTLYIDDNDINKLGIKIENSSKNFQSTYKLNLMDLDESNYSIPPTEFTSVISMNAQEFHRICKDLYIIADNVEIKSLQRKLIFTANGEIASNEVICGETSNGLNIECKDNEEIIQGNYDLKNLILFTKCTNLCTNVELYMKNDYPLVIKYCVASLGYIHLCLSSITNNKNNYNNDDDDSDYSTDSD